VGGVAFPMLCVIVPIWYLNGPLHYIDVGAAENFE